MIRLQKWSFDKKCLGKLQDVRLGKSCRLGRAGCVASLLWTVQFAGLLDESCFLCQKSGKPFSHPILRCENLFPHLFFCYIFQTSIEAWDHPLSSNSSWRHAPAESGVLDMAQNFLLMKCISLRSSAIPLGISMFYLKANTVVVTQLLPCEVIAPETCTGQRCAHALPLPLGNLQGGKPPRFGTV